MLTEGNTKNSLQDKRVGLKQDTAIDILQLREYVSDLKLLIKQRDKAYNSLESAHLDSLERLVKASAFKDDDTGVHISRMCKISEMISRSHGEDDDFCKLILQASRMHDIGKIGIPDSILKKSGSLTPSEWEEMRKHPQYGYDILKDSSVPMIEMAAEIALTHHEKFDGSGYPRGLKGSEIPLSGQIVAIADFFDALTMTRCYRPAMSDDVALSMIEDERGKHFSPQIVDTFFRISNDIIYARNVINRDALLPIELS